MGRHVTESEVLDCLRAGWRMQFVPQHISGVSRETYDPDGETRDLWLWRFRADDHPDLELEWAAMMLWEMDKVRVLETDDGVGLFMLTEIAPPHAEKWSDVAAEMKAR